MIAVKLVAGVVAIAAGHALLLQHGVGGVLAAALPLLAIGAGLVGSVMLDALGID